MRGSAESNSALILSLWQCKFAWFFADPTNKDANRLRGSRRTLHAMESIYEYMKPLRLAIHHHPRMDVPIHIPIPEIARHFNSIVLESGIPHDVWTGELHSLMEELVSINHVLKDYQHRFLVDASDMNKNSTSTLRDSFDHIHQQPKFTVCLLTLWYWLVVWCFPTDDYINSDVKNEFLLAIESDYKLLARCLVDPRPIINSREQHHLQNLFTMLIKMMKLDLQHWIDALDHFTSKMANAGILRGQVKKVFNAAGALKDDGSTPMLSPTEIHKRGLVMSAPKFLSKKGWLTKLVRDALIQEIFSEVVDNLEHVVVNIYHGMKDAADFLVEEIPEVAEEVGHEVVEIAKKVGSGVEHFVHVVSHEVSHLGHIIAEGMNRFAEGVHSVANKVGHFFSHLF